MTTGGKSDDMESRPGCHCKMIAMGSRETVAVMDAHVPHAAPRHRGVRPMPTESTVTSIHGADEPDIEQGVDRAL